MAAKIAAEIRKNPADDEHDLGNFTSASANDLILAAFSTPISSSIMFRATFVCGGGKLVRAKYPDSLPKDLMSALSSIGYKEDGGAHTHISCAGSFKYQHDTGKNLKYVHVYPRICETSFVTHLNGHEDNSDGEEKSQTPSELVLTASQHAFEGILSCVPSLNQKKTLLNLLKQSANTLKSADAKLVKMEPLTTEEQALYDMAVEIPEKAAWLSTKMEEQVEKGPLTHTEQKEIAEKLTANLAKLTEEMSNFEIFDTNPKAVKLQKMHEVLTKKKEALSAIKPSVIPVKRASEYSSLQKQLAVLEKIEQSKVPQPLEVMMQLSKKPSILAQIKEIEDLNLGWFENVKDVEARMKNALGKGGSEGGSANKTAGASSKADSFTTVKNGSKPNVKKPESKASSNPWAALQND